MEKNAQVNKRAELTIKREFEASKEIVFDAFADPDAMAEWCGPPGNPITVVKFDFRMNGIFHYQANMQGAFSWGRFVYQKIERPNLLEFISSFSNESGEIMRAPFSNLFPLEISNRLQFDENHNKTTVTLTGHPVNASEAEIDFFISMSEGIQQGFGGTFDQLGRYLMKLKRKHS